MSIYEKNPDNDKKLLSDTGVECVVCKKGNMWVRIETKRKDSDSLTQQLECENCGESYPRVVSTDRKIVIHDPLKSEIRKGR